MMVLFGVCALAARYGRLWVLHPLARVNMLDVDAGEQLGRAHIHDTVFPEIV